MTTDQPPANRQENASSADRCVPYTLLAIAIMLVGAATRLRMFLANRSFWQDEAALALNITRRSLLGLWRPLDYNQGAPIGFLMLDKLSVIFLGNNERAMRLWPLMASLIALPLFYLVCRKTLRPSGAVIALVLLALTAKQLYYSTEHKQYSTDVLVTVALLLLALKTLIPVPTRRGLIALGAGGAIAVWFSHPAIFVLAAIAAMWLTQRLNSAAPLSRGTLGAIAMAAAAVLASFAIQYFVVLRPLNHSDYMLRFWSNADAFAPVPDSLEKIDWYKKRFTELFVDPAALGFEGAAVLVFILGCITLYRRNRPVMVLVLTPILLALAASVVHKYPFRSRMLLFIGPLLAVTIGAGFDYLLEAPRRTVGVVALVMLMFTPLDDAVAYLRHPPLHCEMRDSVSYIAAHSAPTDAVYVFWRAHASFDYYQARYGLTRLTVVYGAEPFEGWDAFRAEISKFRGRRLWVVFEQSESYKGQDVQQGAVQMLDGMGQRLAEIQPTGEYAACYELRP